MTGVNNMVVGAGIIPLLIELTKVENPARASVRFHSSIFDAKLQYPDDTWWSQYVARGIGLTDSILYGSANAFSIFLNAGGVTVMIDRIKVRFHVVPLNP
jgi:hypothetical protein